MKTALQELLSEMSHPNWDKLSFDARYQMFDMLLELEKEQIQKAFSDGQETPINHPTLPHYSREEYYNDNYNQNK